MADRKALERAAAVDGNVNLSKSSAPSNPDLSAQGESLFLPYLVEHLRSSLQQQPVPPVRRRRQEGRAHTAPQHVQAPAHYSLEAGRVEDSGTESGEDLRFLAAGLRDSIELHRQGSSREQDASQGILGEVQSALSRLHSSLQQGCIGNDQVDPSKQDSLLHLIERLQNSLQLPTAGSSWTYKQMKPSDLPPTGGTQGPQENSQRFAARRSNRRARHTIGVTREELADVRRFLEEAEMLNKMSANAAVEDQDKPPEIPPLPSRVRSPYDLVKQSSAGDVPTITASAGSAFRPYRPTHFLPKRFDESQFAPSQYAGLSDTSRNVSSDETFKTTEDSSLTKKPPDSTSKEMNDDETDDDDDEDQDDEFDDAESNFVEEQAVTGKAWLPEPVKGNAESADSTNAARPVPNSAEYDPSSKLFTASQSVQIAVHKAAINKQLSVEEEKRHAQKAVQSETSDEDTMTDASYESETEKAESDGYEEEDKEDEEEDHERDNLRNNAKNNSSVAPAKIVRNLTYTIQPKESPVYIQRLTQKQPPARVAQDGHSQGQLHLERRQDQSKQLQQSNNKNQRVQKQENRTTQPNNPRPSDHRTQPLHPKDYPPQNRKAQQVYRDTNQKYIETSSKHHHQPQIGDDHLNGKVNKLPRTEPAKGSSHKEAPKNVSAKEDSKMYQEDRNNNFPSTQTPSHVVKPSVEQKVVQISQAELPKSARFANRQQKKQKMKRANTIDIPKPLHHYGVEDDSEVSSDEDSQASQNNNNRTVAESAKSTPMSTQKGAHNPGQNVAPNHQHIEHDRRGSVPQKLEKKVKNVFEQYADADNHSHNPLAHGGTQWNNRFANIKTCFEGTGPRDTNANKQPDSMSRARSFWRSADDSSLKVSKNSAFHEPKLTKQGSQFLKKLHEQKDQGQSSPKLPWTATEHETVVVGSLVVPANLTKSTQPVSSHGPVNKFSHAPMSAFRPIEKKTPAPGQHTPWAAPSVTGSVKQIATSKFSQSEAQPPPAVLPAKQEPPKLTVRAQVNLSTPHAAPSSASPTLPWTKDVSHGHNLNSALAKFESMSSRESSPQLMPNALLRSHSQDRVPLLSNFAVFNKNVPPPPPRTYIPAPQTNFVQTRTQNLTAPFRHEQGLPFIHEQHHPHPLVHSKSNQYLPQSNVYSGPMKSHPLLEGDCQFSDSDQDEPASSDSHLVLSTLHGTSDQSPLSNQTSNGPHVQTYSAGVTARQSVYGVVRHPVMVRTSSLPDQRDVHPPPQPPMYHDSHTEPEMIQSPLHSATGDFAEEHTAAVARVMGQQQCQAAITVSHKTRRCNEDEEGELGTAAFHLASLLHKFSGENDGNGTNKLAKPNDKAAYEGSKSPGRELDQWSPAMTPNERPHQEFRRSSAAQPGDLPPKPEGSPRPARADASFNRIVVDSRNRSFAEPRQDRFPREIPRSMDMPDDNGVYASRFEIPVNKVQSITLKFQSSAHEPPSELFEERKPPVSPNPGIVLRKSESWHQLAAQQQGLSRRPQSMVVADLPPVKPRSPNAIPKAKSSHSLAFPKQFEAAIKPEALEMKQKTVEEFLKKGKSEYKITPPSSVQKHSKTRHKVQTTQSLSEKRSFSSQSSGVFMLDDNLENVDEAFESLFNATSSTEKTKHSSSASSRTATNRR